MGLNQGSGEANPTTYDWTVRVQGLGEKESRVYVGNHAFSVGKQASFSREEGQVTSVEYLLGALGGDLVMGFQRQAAKKGAVIDSVECVVTGRLDNPLVFLGVIGASGRPGFGFVRATLYVSSGSEKEALLQIWQDTLATSPLVDTLKRSATVSLDLKVSG